MLSKINISASPVPKRIKFSDIKVGECFTYGPQVETSGSLHERAIYIKLSDDEQDNAIRLAIDDLSHSGTTTFSNVHKWFFRSVSLTGVVGDSTL